MQTDSLLTLKDDMVAFIEGHGMRRFPGFVGEDVPSIAWEDEINPDKDKKAVFDPVRNEALHILTDFVDLNRAPRTASK